MWPRTIRTFAPTWIKFALINRYHTSLLAYFIEKLHATPDGDGTLLDHSLILYGSSMSNGNQHDHDPLPVVVAGGASGKLAWRPAYHRAAAYAHVEPAAEYPRQTGSPAEFVRRQHGDNRDLTMNIRKAHHWNGAGGKRWPRRPRWPGCGPFLAVRMKPAPGPCRSRRPDWNISG